MELPALVAYVALEAFVELPALFVRNDDGTESLLNFSIDQGDVLCHLSVQPDVELVVARKQVQRVKAPVSGTAAASPGALVRRMTWSPDAAAIRSATVVSAMTLPRPTTTR